MPGPWIHLEDNPDFYATFSVEKGSYLEVNVYDDSHAEQGKALVRVLASEDRKREGLWIQGRIIEVTDPHLQWWLSAGPGNATAGRFYFHLCNAKVAVCRKTKRKPKAEFHTDYFRLVSAAEVTGFAVSWFKDPQCRPGIEQEVARLTGKPAAAGEGTPVGKAKGAKKGEIEWEPTEVGDAPMDHGLEEEGVKKKLQQLQKEVAGQEAKEPPAGEAKKKKKKKKKDKAKKALKDRRKRGGKRKRDKLESDDSSLTDNRPMWFGKKQEEESSSSSTSTETEGDNEKEVKASGSKDKPEKAKGSEKKKKKKKKEKEVDRGPYGVGAKVSYGGRDEEMISSEDDLSDKTSFRAAPSHQSKQLQLQEYAQKYPGRLSSRLLKRMETILARGEGAMNVCGNNQTPATATAYMLTVIETRYKDRLNLRTSRELRSLTRALDCLALGKQERAADIIAQRIKAIELYLADQVWTRAQFLELIPPEGVTLVEQDEVMMSTREQWSEHKMKIALTHGSWKGQTKGTGSDRREDKGKSKGKGKA
eukprot:Skav215636  [mRNA]  locus=scaffold736:67052:68650:+ [translate_table: standard]